MITRKINKIIATRCQILRLKCTKFDLGLRPRAHWENLQRSPDPVAEFKEPYFLGEGRKEKRERERKGERKGGRKGKGKEVVQFLELSM